MQSNHFLFCFSNLSLTRKQNYVNFSKRSTCSSINDSFKFVQNKRHCSFQANLFQIKANSDFLLTSTRTNKGRKTGGRSKKLTNFLQFLLYNSIALKVAKGKTSTSLDNKCQTSRKPTMNLDDSSNSENKLYNKKSFLIVPDNTNSIVKKTTELNPLALNSIGKNSFFIFQKQNSFFNSKKWSSFFPYRKSFICYWLLPFLGFVSYLSSHSVDPLNQVNFSYKKNSLVFNTINLGCESSQKDNSNWTISFNTSNSKLSQREFTNKNESIYFPSPWSISKAFSNNDKAFTDLVSLLGEQPKSFSSAFLIPQFLNIGLKDIWYKMSFSYTSLPSQISFNNLKYRNINTSSLQYIKYYPEKFYTISLDQPHLLQTKGQSNTPFGYLSIHSSALQNNANNFTLDGEASLLSSNTFLQSRIIPNKIQEGKKNLKNHFSFISKGWPLNLTKSLKNFREVDLLSKKSTKLIKGETLLGISRIANNTNFAKANVKIDFLRHPKDLVYSTVINSGNLISIRLNKNKEFLFKENYLNKKHISSQNVKIANLKNPILSYKKASLILDDFLKTLVTLKISNNIYDQRPYKYTDLDRQYNIATQMCTISKTSKTNISFDLDTQSLKLPTKTQINMLKLVDKNENLRVYFPSYLNKVFKNLNFLSITNGQKERILQNNSSSSFTKPISKKKIESSLNNKKHRSSVLHEMIYFLGKQKNCFNNTTNINKDTTKKLDKDQFYSIVRNSLKNSFDSLINCPRTNRIFLQNQEFSNKTLGTNNQSIAVSNTSRVQDQILLPKQNSLDISRNLCQLNHPLMFSRLPQINSKSSLEQDFNGHKPSIASNFYKLKSKKKELQEIKTSADLGWKFFLMHKNPTNVPTTSILGKLSQIKNSSSIRTKKETRTDNPSLSSVNFANIKKDKTFYSKYVNFLSLRFKQILIPFYPSLLLKEKENRKNTRIEKIFRSYLSKKRKPIKPKTVYMPLSRLDKLISLKEFVRSNDLTALKNKTNIILWTRKNNNLIHKSNRGQERQKLSLLNSNRILIKKTNNLLGKGTAIQSKTVPYLGEQGNQNLANNNPISKTSSYTLNSLLKNRVFILKSARIANKFSLARFSGLNTGTLALTRDNSLKIPGTYTNKSYFDKLEKRKYSQKKHRRKKQRKETRRRKKRKRFYPRPIWSRYRMYKNFLDLTFGLPKALNGNPATIYQSTSITSTAKRKAFINSSNKSLVCNLNLDKKCLFRKISLGRHGLLKNLPLYSTKDFYQLKRSVLGELKHAFWKSYWLRSNLKPYLNHIKIHLKEIEKSSTKTTLYLNLRSLIMSLSGLTKSTIDNGYTSDTRIWGSVLPSSNTAEGNFYTLAFGHRSIDNNNTLNLHFLNNTQSLYRVLGKKGISTNSSFNTLNSTIKQGITNQNYNKWQLITQVSEHNRIMYERLQNLILNIRENLTLNGQFKARPYQRPGYQKLKGFSTVKQNNNNTQTNPDFWSKLGKTTSSLFTRSSIKYYGNFSKYRLYWAIHKSNVGSFKTINKVKSIWMNTKNRDQRKANKTKKIFYDIKKKYDSFLNSSSIGEKFQLETAQKAIPKNFNGTLQSNPQNIYSSASGNNSIDKDTTNLFGLSSTKKIKLSLQLSERKLRQKEQKLNFLGIYTRKVAQRTLITKKRHKAFDLTTRTNTGHINKFTNEMNYWWNNSKIQFVPTFNNTFSSRTVLPLTNFSVSSSISYCKVSTCQDFTNKITILGAIPFLFHFCALISLISISQIRDFIKFILIVTSKVSKVYLHFIYSSFNSFMDFTKNLGLTPLKKPTNLLFFQSGLRYSKNTAYTYKGANNKKSRLDNYQKRETGESLSLSFLNSSESNQLLQSAKEVEPVVLSKRSALPLAYKILYPSKSLYYFFVSCLKNPFLLFPPKSIGQKSTSKLFLTKNQKIQMLYTILRYSSVNALLFSLSNLSYFTYTYFTKSLNFIETFVRSIYMFFEKPGELIIDWMAFLFLVEWSSDFSSTIPDTVDRTFSHSLTKFSRTSRFPLLSTTQMSTEIVKSIGFGNSMSNSFLVPVLSEPFLWVFSLLSGSLIQRQILSMYEIFVNLACRPDADLLSRQHKGSIFWDLWSDLLIGVAEDSNINVSELSNLKEEQNRLLEKLLNFSGNLIEVKDFSMRLSNNSVLKENLKSEIASFLNLTPQRMTQKSNKVLFSTFFITNRFPNFWNPSFSYNNYNSSKVNKIRKQANSKSIGWSTSQFLSYQGKDTELFIDLHPPKSFSHLTSIKYSESINQPIGLVLCQIFSGIFYKQIAKNLLVVGPPGPEKSMLIQAIAGETELKIITDNAHRYAMVFRGVAIGIKLLRDVFEALTLHTPCIFLLEDIHAIGERRPFLISDDENAKGTESSIYQDRDEIHEKNQVVYQLTKHIISHYKKPYKGDFSLLIPTNHFCFELFNSTATNVQRSRATNLTPSNPLSLVSKSTLSAEKSRLTPFQNSAERSGWDLKGASKTSQNSWNNSFCLTSSLQLPKNQLLAPPATSPFSVLVLKEEKKLKPKKIVKEFPWPGLPGEQYANISKATYSIRVKVALLADMVLSNLSVKLDMITDLLVIIDSVKGNRGFAVFATTHVPYILDPALRRPGRFDETLSLPQIPSLLSRWEILKSNISLWQHKNSSLKKSSSSSLNYGEPFSIYPIGISFSLWQTNHSSFFHSVRFYNNSVGPIYKTMNYLVLSKTKKRTSSLSHVLSLSSSNLAMQSLYNSLKHIPFEKYLSPLLAKGQSNTLLGQISVSLIRSHQDKKDLRTKHLTKLNAYKLIFKGEKDYRTILILRVYNIVSKIFISLQQCTIAQNALSNSNKWGDFSLSLLNSHSNSLFGTTINRALSNDSLVYASLYSSPHIFKQHLTILMAGQIGQTFAKINWPSTNKRINFTQSNLNLSQDLTLVSPLRDLTNTNNTFNSYLSSNSLDNMGLINLTGIDKTWKTATSLVFSFIQKRWIYQKNLIVPRLLDFGFEGHKTEIPSPPSSNILLPAKRYENYKRTFTYSQLKRKTHSSINEKIQLHQQQRLVKRLYKIPLKEYFRSEILTSFNVTSTTVLLDENTGKNTFSNFTSFSNASIILTPLQTIQQTPTSINWYFRHRLLNRHQTYLSNQWWNGQLQEHNTERNFLSDVDWRFAISSTRKGSMGDLFIDFPDAEQYYNPKNQRWINTSGSWNSWFDFQKPVYQQYSLHYIFECVTNAYKCLDQNRELLDYYVINILEKGLGTGKELDELDILELFKRFSK